MPIARENQDIDAAKAPKRLVASTVAILMILLIFAAASVASYGPMKDSLFATKDNTKTYMESYEFPHTLIRLTRYLKETKIQEGNDWYDPWYENAESIYYYISDREKTFSISNVDGITEDKLQDEIKNSQFYLRASFDESGNVEIENSLGRRFHKDIFINGLGLSNEDKVEYANLDIVYIVPKDFEKHNDFLAYNMKHFHVTPNYFLLILAIGAVSILILMIMAFAIPYSFQSKTGMCRLFNKMFLEFKALLWLGFGIIPLLGISLPSYYSANSFNVVDAIYYPNIYFYLIGIPVTFVLYLLTYLTIVYIKYIYHTGFKEGLICNSVLGKLSFYMLGSVKQLLRQAMEIDVRKDCHKKLFMTLTINLFILWIIALSRFFGVILAIVYSIFLFKYLLKMIDRVKALEGASNQLAEGNFAITLDEDMGILSPISENLNNIKDGFQLAVDKETKSQKMKAELISNVSHDLKTPLTSIITYVDLLKKEDNTPEAQKEFIGILDKKSKRLKVLIEDLFEASKASSGNIELSLENLDVVALFRQTLGELEEKINDSTLQMKINTPENKIICKLDGKRTYRIFENIMSNILKYAMPNSRVYIDLVESQQEVRFIFKNISAYEMNFDTSEITERFTRGDRSRHTEGSGLGLSIAKSFIELQKGRLEINIDGDLFKLIVTFPKAG
ncbi:histidine kinase [Clostridium aceticum]|nr:histidine kinase [Clostridium aceticum]